ncbi:DUF7261 family protein [Halosimplex halobium]|uniref:DUF7261 family protein n=1 Tax=Halosimplex halobium TaxID=3396618 RepID=UPI003F54675F
MADLNGVNRGQLLLSGAFVLAVALIGLTIVLTSGGYTTTLTTQDTSVERGTDAIATRESVSADLERYLRDVNEEPTATTTRSARKDSFRDLVSQLGPWLNERYAEHGQLVDIGPESAVSFERGYQIELATDGSFDRLDTSRNGPGTETLVSDAKARNVTFVFSDVPTGSSSFDVTFDSGSREWLLTVTATGGGSQWTVTVDRTGTTYARTCTVTGSPSEMTVDVDGATIDGDHCLALEAIEFEEDNYEVTISGDLSGTSGQLWLTGEGTPPSTSYDDSIVYSARVPFTYQSATVDYRTELRIAPEEIR